MSEFYTMPITTAKTNDSYIIPTSTQGSLFSTFSAGHHETRNEAHKKSSIGRKFKKLLGRETKI